jgi:methionyl-tRNA synthetase
MSTHPRHILVAVGWPYANGLSHLGHIAGAYLPPDIFARYHRLAGNEVLMVSGTDAHGTPITIQAEAEGIEPREVVERYHPRFLEQWERLGIAFDLFTTTMTDNHRDVTQDVFRRLHANGFIGTKVTAQMFDPVAERFLPDRYVEGTCPHCGYDGARGDQCDSCGRTLDPTELIDPRSKLSDGTPEPRDTEHYFILLPKLQDTLSEWLATREGWRPHVIQWARSFVDGGLLDRAITRDLTWVVRIPEGFDTIGEGKRIYVWFDAVIGYLSASIEWAAGTGDPDAWKAWWLDPSAESYYFVGKDNVPFHAVFWPSYLAGMNAGAVEGGVTVATPPDAVYNLPTNVPANQFVTFKGAKASKSRGIGTPVLEYLDTYTADQLRYALAANLPEQNDTDISEEELLRRVNEELANAWGNLVNRVLTMTRKRFDEVVPTPDELTEADEALLARCDELLAEEAAHIEAVELRAGLRSALSLAQDANAYLNAQEPWKVVKEDRDRAATILWTVLQAIDAGKVAFAPYTPFSSDVIHGWLGHEGSLADGGWARSEVVAGRPLGEPEVLFPRVELAGTDGD